MADEMKVYEDVPANATAGGSGCGNCNGHGLKNAIITPCKITYTAKLTCYATKKAGQDDPDRVYLTPNKDVSYKMEFMKLDSIEDGAFTKDPYVEFKDYVNSTRAPEEPEMTTEDATKMLKEIGKTLKKKEYKTLIEKAIKNHLDPKFSKNHLTFDAGIAGLIDSKFIDALSFKGWKTFATGMPIQYQVEADLGVNPVFMKNCHNLTDKSKLSISSPNERVCKSLVVGLNTDKSNNLFCLFPKDPYTGDGKFTGKFRNIADGTKLFSPGFPENTAKPAELKVMDESRVALASALSNSGSSVYKFVPHKGSFDLIYDTGEVSIGTEIQVTGSNVNAFGKVLIGVNVNCNFGDGKHGIKWEILIGGKYFAMTKGILTAARIFKNCIEMLVQAINRPHEKGDYVKDQAAAAAKLAADLKAKIEAAKTEADRLAALAKEAARLAAEKAEAEKQAAAAQAVIDQAEVAKAKFAEAENAARKMNSGDGETVVTAEIKDLTGVTPSDALPRLDAVAEAAQQGNFTGAVAEATAVVGQARELGFGAQDLVTGSTALVDTTNVIVAKGLLSDNDVYDVLLKAAGEAGAVANYNELVVEIVKAVEAANILSFQIGPTQLVLVNITPTTPATVGTSVKSTDTEPVTPILNGLPNADASGGRANPNEGGGTPENLPDAAPGGTVGGRGGETAKDQPYEGEPGSFQTLEVTPGRIAPELIEVPDMEAYRIPYNYLEKENTPQR